SIETIATVIHNKLNGRHQVVSSTTKEEHIDTDLIKENEIKLSHNSNYTEQSSTNTDNLSKLFIDKIYEQQNQTRSVLVYAIKIPSMTSAALTSTYAVDMILQMRRIQPREPYRLVAVRKKQEEIIVHEMIKQLKDHLMTIDIRLLLLDD
ncbi:unnamed protein product, partial [Adineta steineri]